MDRTDYMMCTRFLTVTQLIDTKIFGEVISNDLGCK